MSVQYATYENKSAALSSDFGYDFACKLFGKETVDQMPRYGRGKNAGKLKGFVGWRNCTVGGWSKAHGGVVYPGKCGRAWLSMDFYSDDRSAVYLNWCGDNTAINFDRCYLYDAGRAARMAEKARDIECRIEQHNDYIDELWTKIVLLNGVIAALTATDMTLEAIETLAIDRAKHERSIASIENQLFDLGVRI